MESGLEALVARTAKELAKRLSVVASKARKEEEVRITVEQHLFLLAKESGLMLEGRPEFTLAHGSVDSVYDRVIIEYKNPRSPADRIGPRAESAGTRKLVDQIKRRFLDMEHELGHPLGDLFGVGLDGRFFVFVRHLGGCWSEVGPVEVNEHSVEDFLWTLLNVGRRNKSFSPDHLSEDFGSEARLAREGVKALYGALVASEHPRVLMFFKQWRILFGEVCGFDVDNPTKHVIDLASNYGVAQNVRAAELLFSIHTYYAVFMKLLAGEIVTYSRQLPTPLQRVKNAGTCAKLLAEMIDLESGSIFRHIHISNFLEGDLFSWYLAAWSDSIEWLIRDMVAKLGEYSPATLSDNPSGSRDLLKKLYQELFPRSVRHDLGEYYTPDWLAEHVLNEIGFDGDPKKRVLDPACGSGTFLVTCINKIRSWYDQNRPSCTYDETELSRLILSNVVGFDLNPLAVMAARTNYLVAMHDLIGHLDRIEIPVYLCDSIQTPSSYGNLFTGSVDSVRRVRTAVADFHIPSEMVETQEALGRYVNLLESCVANQYPFEDFRGRMVDEGLKPLSTETHRDLYEQILTLDREDRNGVWVRIIKNAFAPLFIGKVDYIVGNPPWINWESLPEDYRNGAVDLWQTYGLVPERGQLEKMRGGKKDLSMLFVYVAADRYLKQDGWLGYVITQSLFKTGAAAAGFRRFALPDGVFLRVVRVDDMSALSPFEDATNRTAVLIVEKSKSRTHYPVRYDVWMPGSLDHVAERRGTYGEVMASVRVLQKAARPSSSSPVSAWLTAPAAVLSAIGKVRGRAEYVAREGVNTGGLSGCFWVKILLDDGGPTVVVENLAEDGKKSVPRVRMAVERELLFPLVRGRDSHRWCSQPSAYILAPQDSQKQREGIAETVMRRQYPQAYAYLKSFEGDLAARADRKYYPEGSPFYTMRNVADYTRSAWKVVFKDLSETLECAVLGPVDSGGIVKPVFPDLTLRLVPVGSEAEAHYVAALLNSSPAIVLLHASSSGVQTQRYHPGDIEKVRLPHFDSKKSLHSKLASISRLCHRLACDQATERLQVAEHDLDKLTGELWGLSDSELAAIRDSRATL